MLDELLNDMDTKTRLMTEWKRPTGLAVDTDTGKKTAERWLSLMALDHLTQLLEGLERLEGLLEGLEGLA